MSSLPRTEIRDADAALTRVKVCGIRRIQDAVLAADLGASAVGLVFWPESPRFIDPYRARAIAAALPPGVTPVGVFVDQPVEFVMGVARLIPLGAVQLHGSESIASFVAPDATADQGGAGDGELRGRRRSTWFRRT